MVSHTTLKYVTGLWFINILQEHPTFLVDVLNHYPIDYVVQGILNKEFTIFAFKEIVPLQDKNM